MMIFGVSLVLTDNSKSNKPLYLDPSHGIFIKYRIKAL
jgi:hypothetical protein